MPLSSVKLGLRGRADMVIAAPKQADPEARLIVVEYKLTERRALRNWKLQIAAYALLFEEVWERPVARGYIYHIGRRHAEEVRLTAALRSQVVTTVTSINRMIAGESLPAPPRNTAVCVSCEFRRFCNDVV